MPYDAKDNARDKRLQRTYGITLEQYTQLYKRQKGRCKVCKRSSIELGQTLSVDHDHSTGEVRGLLCTFCNRYVVGRHRDAVLLSSAGRYLKGPFTGWFVPKKPKRKKKK